jgi:hypothetical protein
VGDGGDPVMRRLAGGLAGLVVVVSLFSVGFAQLRQEQINDRDCVQALERQKFAEQNDVGLVRDIADAIEEAGGNVNPVIIDDIEGRIGRRYDRLPPPPDCEP